MIKKYAGVLVLAAVTSMSAGCGSGGSSATHDTAGQQPTTQQPSTQTSPSSTSGASGFCAHIAPAGTGPAEAFGAIQLWQRAPRGVRRSPRRSS